MMDLSPSRRQKRRLPSILMLLALFAAAVMAVIPVSPSVRADYPDNFDSYPLAATTLGPWTLTNDSSPCWSSTSIGDVQSHSAPNAVTWIFDSANAGCDSAVNGHVSDLKAYFNASSPSVAFSVWMKDGVTGSPSFSIDVNYCGNPTAPGGTSISGSWVQYSFSVTTTPGTKCLFDVRVATLAAAGSYYFYVFLDDAFSSGADAVLPSFNFVMTNLNTGNWYNISDYPTSVITVEYLNAPNYPVSAPRTPDLNLPLTANHGASAVSVCVNPTYCNTFIPGLSTHGGVMTVWLVAPGAALACLFQVASPSDQFPTGTQIEILAQGSSGRIMASGYIDANHQFPAFLPAGTFNVELSLGSLAYSTTVIVSAVSTSFSITVSNVLGNAFVSGLGSISYNAGWDSTLQNIVYYFDDSTISTTYVKVEVEIFNSTGLFIGTQVCPDCVHTFIPTERLYGYVFGSFATCDTDKCNSTMSATMSVLFIVTSQFCPPSCPAHYGPVGLIAPLPGIPGTPPSGSLGGLNEFLPGTSYVNIGAFLALAAVASATGEYDSTAGAIILIFFAAVLVGLGAMNLPDAVLAGIAVLVILAFMEQREKRSQNPYAT